MKYTVRDDIQRHRYQKLSSAQQLQVDQVIERHLAACKKMDVVPEIEPTFKEAIDMVVNGKWEEDRPIERTGVRWHYDVYTSPLREAA